MNLYAVGKHVHKRNGYTRAMGEMGTHLEGFCKNGFSNLVNKKLYQI